MSGLVVGFRESEVITSLALSAEKLCRVLSAIDSVSFTHNGNQLQGSHSLIFAKAFVEKLNAEMSQSPGTPLGHRCAEILCRLAAVPGGEWS
mgnify:CR=1 FL=1